MLAQISAYMANANNEQRRSETGSCELSRLGSSEATERLGLQKARGAPRQRQNEVLECELLAQKGEEKPCKLKCACTDSDAKNGGEKERRHNGTD